MSVNNITPFSFCAAINTTVYNLNETKSEYTLHSKAEKRKIRLINTVNDILDKPYLKTNIELKDDGKYYLVITRPSLDKDRPNEEAYDNIAMDNFKRSLGLKDGIIKNCKYNDSFAITKRSEWSDHGTMEKGSSLYIPIDELGKKYYFFGGGDNKTLEKAVRKFNHYKEYLNSSFSNN